jgi:formylglycine-generating enzyme required for sulfatase activity
VNLFFHFVYYVCLNKKNIKMKRIIIGLFTLLAVTSWAQKTETPETVYPIVVEQRSYDWYVEHAAQWKKVIDNDKTNEDAWLNYYRASRAANQTNPKGWGLNNDAVNAIADEMEKAIPNTYVYNYVRWWVGGNNSEMFPYLQKAYEIAPDRYETYEDFMTYYEIEQKKEEYSEFCVKKYNSNTISPSLYNWNYNLLMTLEKDAILIVGGDNDTYPGWILQEAKSIRKDVKILNMSLLTLKGYRDKVFEELGIPKFEKTFADYGDYAPFCQGVIEHITQSHRKYSLYISTSAPRFLHEHFEDKLYLVGLAFKYSSSEIDNISLIKRNYEKRYKLDYLSEVFHNDRSQKIVDNINGTYLASMIKLYKHYKQSEDHFNAKIIEQLISKVSKRSGQEANVGGHMNAEENGVVKTTMQASEFVNMKKLEKRMISFDENIYMSKYEVTNIDYQTFLNSLLQSRNINAFKAYLYDSSQWTTKFSYSYNEPMKELYHWHPAYDEYPVVNVTYEAAVKYCEWLTVSYNAYRKREFKKVLFRLPTEKEWEQAALGKSYGTQVKTPFVNDEWYDKNKKCYNANLKEGDRYFDDGAFHTVMVERYSPNSLGIYQMIGNVAEMVSKEGVTKGGSWASEFNESYVNKNKTYELPDPRVGFRIVMEVIEK